MSLFLRQRYAFINGGIGTKGRSSHLRLLLHVTFLICKGNRELVEKNEKHLFVQMLFIATTIEAVIEDSSG